MQPFSLMGEVNIRKCGIIGIGNLGSTVAFSLIQTGWFSDLVLIDPDREKALREAEDLSFGLPFHAPMNILAGSYADLSDCGVIILSADWGLADPWEANAQVLRSVVNNVSIYNQTAVLVVVANPSEIMTCVACAASGFPPRRVIGFGTLLDTARLRRLLGVHLGVDRRQIDAFVIGERGKQALAVWSMASVEGIALQDFAGSADLAANTRNRLLEQVKATATETPIYKGASCYALAESVKRIVSAVVRDENAILPVSTLVEGAYGIENIFLSLPCVINRHGIARVLEIPLQEGELAHLQASALAIRERLGKLKSFGVTFGFER